MDRSCVPTVSLLGCRYSDVPTCIFTWIHFTNGSIFHFPLAKFGSPISTMLLLERWKKANSNKEIYFYIPLLIIEWYTISYLLSFDSIHSQSTLVPTIGLVYDPSSIFTCATFVILSWLGNVSVIFPGLHLARGKFGSVTNTTSPTWKFPSFCLHLLLLIKDGKYCFVHRSQKRLRAMLYLLLPCSLVCDLLAVYLTNHLELRVLNLVGPNWHKSMDGCWGDLLLQKVRLLTYCNNSRCTNCVLTAKRQSRTRQDKTRRRLLPISTAGRTG